MLFNSLEYLIFLPLVVLLYYRLGLRQRQILLLVASYAFYWCWSVKWSVLLATSTVVDFFRGDPHRAHPLARAQEGDPLRLARPPTWACWVSLSTRTSSARRAWRYSACGLGRCWTRAADGHLVLHLHDALLHNRCLPRARQGEAGPARDGGLCQLFPHLVAGPILRAPDLLPQLETYQRFNWPTYV